MDVKGHFEMIQKCGKCNLILIINIWEDSHRCGDQIDNIVLSDAGQFNIFAIGLCNSLQERIMSSGGIHL